MYTLLNLLFVQEEQGFFRTRKFHGEDSNIDLFSSNLGLDFEDEDGMYRALCFNEISNMLSYDADLIG